MKPQTQKLISDLLRKEFDATPDYDTITAKGIIRATFDLRLDDVARQMCLDLSISTDNYNRLIAELEPKRARERKEVGL